MKTRQSLKVPERLVTMGDEDGSVWRLRLDHNALYELEQHTGRTTAEVMKDLAPVPDPDWVPDPTWRPTKKEPVELPRMLPPKLRMTQIYELAWAMSVSHREDEGLTDMTFRQFLRILPHPSELQQIVKQVMSVLAEGFSGGAPDAPRGNDPAPAPAET